MSFFIKNNPTPALIYILFTVNLFMSTKIQFIQWDQFDLLSSTAQSEVATSGAPISTKFFSVWTPGKEVLIFLKYIAYTQYIIISTKGRVPCSIYFLLIPITKKIINYTIKNGELKLVETPLLHNVNGRGFEGIEYKATIEGHLIVKETSHNFGSYLKKTFSHTVITYILSITYMNESANAMWRGF